MNQNYYLWYANQMKIRNRLYGNVELPKTISSSSVVGGQFINYSFVNADVDGGNLVLSESVINELVDQFWSEVMSQVGDHVVMIQVQVKSQDKFYSISKLQTVNTEVKDSLKSLLILNLNLLYSKYYEYPIDSLFIKWKVLDKSNPLAEVKLQKIEAFHDSKITS